MLRARLDAEGVRIDGSHFADDGHKTQVTYPCSTLLEIGEISTADYKLAMQERNVLVQEFEAKATPHPAGDRGASLLTTYYYGGGRDLGEAVLTQRSLGALLSFNVDLNPELRARMSAAWGGYCSHRSFLTCQQDEIAGRRIVPRAAVCSRL